MDPTAISERLNAVLAALFGLRVLEASPHRVTVQFGMWGRPRRPRALHGDPLEGRVEMLERVAIALMVLLPILPIVGLLAWAEWWDRRRAALVARQIRLTDAIGAELGAVVAPVVRRALGGAWRVHMTLPPGRPAVAGRVLEITHRVWLGRYEIRLAPRMEPIASRRHLGAPILGLRSRHHATGDGGRLRRLRTLHGGGGA
jgi:hypothetical protein